MKSVVTVLLLLIAGQSLFAQAQVRYCSSLPVKVTFYSVVSQASLNSTDGENTVIFGVSPNISNALEFKIVQRSGVDYDKLYSLIVLAYANRIPIYVYYNSPTPGTNTCGPGPVETVELQVASNAN